MKEIKFKKTSSEEKVSIFIKIFIVLVCLVIPFTMLFNLLGITGTFSDKFKSDMKNTYTMYGMTWNDDITGLDIDIKGYSFAFGIDEVTPENPYQLQREPVLIVLYFLPLLIALSLIPIKKLENNKVFQIVRSSLIAAILIFEGIYFIAFMTKEVANFESLLLMNLPNKSYPIYTDVNITKSNFIVFMQLLSILAGVCSLYLIVDATKIKTKKIKK